MAEPTDIEQPEDVQVECIERVVGTDNRELLAQLAATIAAAMCHNIDGQLTWDYDPVTLKNVGEPYYPEAVINRRTDVAVDIARRILERVEAGQ